MSGSRDTIFVTRDGFGTPAARALTSLRLTLRCPHG